MENPKKIISKLPSLNEQYGMERVPLDYDGGNGLEIAVDQYESGDFVRDGGNGLEIAVDQYESDDFVRDNWLDWTREPKEHENITNEPSDITNEGDSFDNNETVKIKKNKMISMLAAIAAAYFILK